MVELLLANSYRSGHSDWTNSNKYTVHGCVFTKKWTSSLGDFSSLVKDDIRWMRSQLDILILPRKESLVFHHTTMHVYHFRLFLVSESKMKDSYSLAKAAHDEVRNRWASHLWKGNKKVTVYGRESILSSDPRGLLSQTGSRLGPGIRLCCSLISVILFIIILSICDFLSSNWLPFSQFIPSQGNNLLTWINLKKFSKVNWPEENEHHRIKIKT